MGIHEQNGPQAGRYWVDEASEYRDPETGATVRKLTGFTSHSHQLYYTETSLYDDQSKVLFGSDRTGTKNLYSADLETGVITQLTDLPRGNFEAEIPPPTNRVSAGGASINPVVDEAYFWHDGQLVALDLADLSLRVLYTVPSGFRPLRTSVTADGNSVCTGLTEIKSDTPKNSDPNVSGAERQEWEPTSKIVKVPVDGGDEVEVPYVNDLWIGHPQASPTDPDYITFSAEGPWETQDERLFCLNMETEEVTVIRPKHVGKPFAGISHEHWLSDGEHIGYHGFYEGGQPFYGITRYDNSGRKEVEIPEELLQLRDPGYKSHFHHAEGRIVSDCSPQFPYLVVWPFDEEAGELGSPHKLAYHGGSFQHPRLHVHPRFSRDGRQVIFSSNKSEYQQVYLADVPPIEELPEVDLGAEGLA